MKFVPFYRSARICFQGLMLLCMLGFSPVAVDAAPNSRVEEECQPGSGWRWKRGPSQPETAQRAALALREIGIESRVDAFAFGEQDSCGSFEPFSTDFSVSPVDTALLSPEAEKELSTRILSVLSRFGAPQPGNVRIEFARGNTKFYPAPTLRARPADNVQDTAKALLNKKVFLLVYNPILSNGQDFNTYMGWPAYSMLVADIINSFYTASHGELAYTVTYSHVVDHEWPIKVDGFRYTEEEYLIAYANNTPHEPNDVDYDAILGDPLFDICGRFNRGEINELWIYGGPYDGFYESRLVGPGGYWYNSPPMEQTHGCNRPLPIMGLNFERGVAEAMHSFGHRAESTMVQVYGSWENNRTAHNWDRFALVKALSPSYSYSGCGNIHFPPNGVSDYDYGNFSTVQTNCEDFANYPDLSNPQSVLQSVTCSPWACDHLEYMLYWYSHLPHNPGCGPDGFANDWWLYFSDPNAPLVGIPCPPGSFNRISPSNNSTGVSLSATLFWEGSSSANYYQYCYDIINDNKCNRTWSSPLIATSASITNLGANTKYYWQVRAVNARGTTEANNQTWGVFTTTSTLPSGTAKIETFVGATRHGKYSLQRGKSLRESYTGINNGPVRLRSTNNIPMIAAERVIYKINGINASFTEMMGLPNSLLGNTYWLPWYNSVDLDTQLRIANVSGSQASITIFIGGTQMGGTPFNLAAGASTRISFAGINSGPVRIVSTRSIVAAERVIYTIKGVRTSFSELMALPDNQLSNTYWIPWYDNVNADTQLRLANVSGSQASVNVTIGGQRMTGSPFTLGVGQSIRVSFPGINAGAVKIVSDQNIVAAERVIFKVNNTNTSFSEMMALPNSQVNTTHWLPWYNNVDLSTELRFGNVGNALANIHVYIGEVEMAGSPFQLAPGLGIRLSYAGINNGPVRIVSDVNIVTSERVIYGVSGVNTSFTELMALPNSQLDTTYWLPWYNNVDLDTQLRFGVP